MIAQKQIDPITEDQITILLMMRMTTDTFDLGSCNVLVEG